MPRSEWVLAVRTEELLRGRPLAGAAAGGEAFLRFLFTPRHSRFIPRASAEEDPAWKQIIPYVILHCEGRVFVYRRGKASTESRLTALSSIGLGGHINPGDESLFAAAGWESYCAALQREVSEEVEIPPGLLQRDRIVGVLNDDSLPVGRVHFGIVHIWDLAEPRATPREAKIAAPRFATLAALRGTQAPPLETWSQLCLAAWEELAARPGWVP